MDPDDGADHHDHSIQVSKDATLKLKWQTSGAASVHEANLGDLDASGEQEIPTQDATYSLVAQADGGAESDPYTIEIHTHDPSDVISPHTDVGSGKVAVVSFQALKDDEPVTSAKVGDSLVFTLLVSDATEAAKIGDQDADLTDLSDGHKQAKLTVEITADMDGSFTAQALKDGQAEDTQTLQVDIESDAAMIPHLSCDAGASAAAGTAVTLQYSVENFIARGTTAQISADSDPGDASFTFGGQDVQLGTDGKGELTVTPATAGNYSFKLTVTPDGGAAVDSDPVSLNVAAGAGDAAAEWSTDAVKLGDVAQVKLSGFAPNTEVKVEITLEGVGVIAVPDPVTTDASGVASIDFGDWFPQASLPQEKDFGSGDFDPVTYTAKATAGGVQAISRPLVYADSILAQCISSADGTPLANQAYELHSAFGTKTGTTDDQGQIQVDRLPPGGVRILIAGDVLTTSDSN